MNVSCAQCKTVFRVDPSKVPAEGVRARCSVCGGVFEVLREDEPAEPVAVSAPVEPVPATGEDVSAGKEESAVGAPEPPPTPVVIETPEEEAEPTPVQPEPAAEKPAGVSRSPFGQPDQEARARRLARALISDLAAYHPDRQERGLKEGRLKQLFQDELRKSWQEYVAQVGLDVAKSTPYFRDALNEILAKGKRVF
jgi:predicted Zn finger-like uncharacterized protein